MRLLVTFALIWFIGTVFIFDSLLSLKSKKEAPVGHLFEIGDCLQLNEQYDEWHTRSIFVVIQIGRYSYLVSEQAAIGSEGCNERIGLCNKTLLFSNEKMYNKVSCE